MFRRTFLKVLGLSGAALALNGRAIAHPGAQHYQTDRIPTGFPEFDDNLGGGLHTGSFILVTGRLASGKTAFVNRIQYENVLQQLALGVRAPKLEIHDDMQDEIAYGYENAEGESIFPPRAKVMARLTHRLVQKSWREQSVIIGVVQTREPVIMHMWGEPYIMTNEMAPFGYGPMFFASNAFKIKKDEDGKHTVFMHKNRWGKPYITNEFDVKLRNGPLAVPVIRQAEETI
jgi:hypothetical protein